PRHSAGVVAMAEWEDLARIGVEWYYTGRQRLEADPFRATSEPYYIVGVLAERRFGRYRLFINGENLTDTRQTKWGPMLRPGPAADGRIATDVWAPLDGRTINGGVRIQF
ncbi:MAG TPA: TonB-dependent receptor, partial [Thermoanaerobaculia bacterium]|nr:TonB-dependent receptor [Thermoanaerobaculia bacterium]